MTRGLDAPMPDQRTPEAFVVWVGPHLPSMAHLAARLSGPTDRDDVVQESLARAWQKWDKFDERRGSAASWLLAITADRARRIRRTKPTTWIGPPAGRIRNLEAELDLEYALSRLPPRQRLAVDCFYFADLSIAATAAVMRCSEGTVKSTLSDVRRSLRSLLEETDG